MINSPLIQRVKDTIADLLLLPKLTNRLASLIILLASTQLGHHFWPHTAIMRGIRVVYLSPAIYFLDLLIIGYLVVIYISKQTQLNFKKVFYLIPILSLNLIFSLNPLATLNWSVHFLIYLGFIFNLPRFFSKQLTISLVVGIVFQTLLALTQVFRGEAIQGLFYYLGERSLNLTTPNVARASILGKVILRAYGTFNHPNILAGWLIVAFLSVLQLSFKHRSDKRSSPFLCLGVCFFTFLGVILTHSRAAIFTLLIIIFPVYIFRHKKTRFIYGLIVLSIYVFLFLTGTYVRVQDNSVVERISLFNHSTQLIKTQPLFGVGASSSTFITQFYQPTLSIFQPDHNSLSLFISWFGVVGCLAILYLFLQKYPPSIKFLTVFLPLIPLLLLDHYFLTSPQGLFVLIFYLRVSMNYEA